MEPKPALVLPNEEEMRAAGIPPEAIREAFEAGGLGSDLMRDLPTKYGDLPPQAIHMIGVAFCASTAAAMVSVFGPEVAEAFAQSIAAQATELRGQIEAKGGGGKAWKH